jgi:membrane protein YdbS with pleckstrin-like domain
MHFSVKPSQWINIGWILFGIIGIPLVIPTLVAIYMIIYVECWKYEFYDDQIIRQQGVFSITRTELNVFRIKSVRHQRPFLYRLVGLSTIELVSSDPLNPYMKIVAVPMGDVFIESIQEQIVMSKESKGIRETDIHIL